MTLWPCVCVLTFLADPVNMGNWKSRGEANHTVK